MCVTSALRVCARMEMELEDESASDERQDTVGDDCQFSQENLLEDLEGSSLKLYLSPFFPSSSNGSSECPSVTTDESPSSLPPSLPESDSDFPRALTKPEYKLYEMWSSDQGVERNIPVAWEIIKRHNKVMESTVWADDFPSSPSRSSRHQAMGKVRGRPHRRDIEYCVFCQNNGAREPLAYTHKIKDSHGRVTCPVLRAYTCPTCGACGDYAHTIKYCPMNNSPEAVQAQAAIRRSPEDFISSYFAGEGVVSATNTRAGRSRSNSLASSSTSLLTSRVWSSHSRSRLNSDVGSYDIGSGAGNVRGRISPSRRHH